jgi:hypothetical protein
MKAYGEWMYRSTFFYLGTSWRWVVNFTSGRFTPGERAPGTHWIGGWVDLRAGLDDLEKSKFLTLPGLELRPPSQVAIRYTAYAIPAHVT